MQISVALQEDKNATIRDLSYVTKDSRIPSKQPPKTPRFSGHLRESNHDGSQKRCACN